MSADSYEYEIIGPSPEESCFYKYTAPASLNELRKVSKGLQDVNYHLQELIMTIKEKSNEKINRRDN
jgi:hypothetical protein